MKERKDLIDDALHATRAGRRRRHRSGGGVALLRSGEALKKLKLEGDEALGVQLIKNVLEMPLRKIAENAGLDGSVVANTVRKNSGVELRLRRPQREVRRHAARFGVVDPAKVVRSALQNGASVAALLLTTELDHRRRAQEGREGRPPRSPRPWRRSMGGMGGMGGNGHGWHGRAWGGF